MKLTRNNSYANDVIIFMEINGQMSRPQHAVEMAKAATPTLGRRSPSNFEIELK